MAKLQKDIKFAGKIANPTGLYRLVLHEAEQCIAQELGYSNGQILPKDAAVKAANAINGAMSSRIASQRAKRGLQNPMN